jgi:signal transduction histidine kinase
MSEKCRSNEIQLKVIYDEDGILFGKSSQISQIIYTLISNSFDAIIHQESDRWIEVKTRWIGQTIEISVTDSGKGIPPEIASRVMDPFFTTKEVGKGTGLGLSVALGMAQSHRGTLVYDPQSKNTRFVLTLPMVEPKQKNASQSAA